MTFRTVARRGRQQSRGIEGAVADRRLSVTLIIALTLQGATAALAIDMYTPAFPQVSAELGAPGPLVGMTLAAFSVGMGLGQLFGGPFSDQRGRRVPLMLGSLICLLGAVGCAIAPSIGVLIACRVLEGVGGGVAGVVGRAVVVDLATGARLAKVMSIVTGFSGLAPVVAPVVGASLLSAGGTWRTVFWVLAGFGFVTFAAAVLFVPESLPADRRRPGGISHFTAGMATALRIPEFVGYLLVTTFTAALLFAYVSTSVYVLESINGVSAVGFAAFFASNALLQVALSFVNAAIVGRVRPSTIIMVGLSVSAAGVALLSVGAFLLGAPVLIMCTGFVVMMSGLPFISSNSNALASSAAVRVAGSASALLGVTFSIAATISAPLASSGGGRTAAPMVAVMICGIVGAAVSFAAVRRRDRRVSTPQE